MMKERTYRNFAERNRAIRAELDPLLTIREVRDILRISANHVIRLVRQGHLDGYDVVGNRLDKVDTRSNGIRVSPESLQRFLNSNRI